MKQTADFWIKHLKLTKHVEGGSFAEVYRSHLSIKQENLPASFKGDRAISTSIFFLLEKGQISALHRIASDEIWHFYLGDCLEIYEIDSDGELTIHRLGSNPLKQEQFQCIIKAGSWFGSRVAEEGDYSLVGCTVAPGFHFDDFELADRLALSKQFPQYKDIIALLTY